MYCQAGKTDKMRRRRKEFYSPQQIFEAVEQKVNQSQIKNETINYLAFVPNGEPTLDVNLGRTINTLKSFHTPIAIITNSSLIDRRDIQTDLLESQWISFKVDSVNEKTWQIINRPHGKIKLEDILEGLLSFRKQFTGRFITETMLVSGLNDSTTETEQIARFQEQLQPDIAYISIPTRPPAEPGIWPASVQKVKYAYRIFKQRLQQVELLIGYEGNKFSSLGNVHDDILNITAVHPMRADALQKLLVDAHVDWTLVNNMIIKGEIIESNYQGFNYYSKA